MARILLNTRASRITIVDNILILPAEVRKDERLGNVVKPSRTLISEQGEPSPYARIQADKASQRLLAAGVLEWSTEKADEPEKVANFKGASPYPRIEEAEKRGKLSGSPVAAVDDRAKIDESGRPLEALAKADGGGGGPQGQPGKGHHGKGG
jgi:hypothetical protein